MLSNRAELIKVIKNKRASDRLNVLGTGSSLKSYFIESPDGDNFPVNDACFLIDNYTFGFYEILNNSLGSNLNRSLLHETLASGHTIICNPMTPSLDYTTAESEFKNNISFVKPYTTNWLDVSKSSTKFSSELLQLFSSEGATWCYCASKISEAISLGLSLGYSEVFLYGIDFGGGYFVDLDEALDLSKRSHLVRDLLVEKNDWTKAHESAWFRNERQKTLANHVHCTASSELAASYGHISAPEFIFRLRKVPFLGTTRIVVQSDEGVAAIEASGRK